jgi:hypothetical protein
MCSIRLGKCWEVCDTWKTGWRTRGEKAENSQKNPGLPFKNTAAKTVLD